MSSLEGSQPIKGGQPPQPVPKAEGVDELLREAKSPLASVPISSIKFTLPETLKEDAVPIAMQAKATSIFTVKSLMLGGTITQMQPALAGVGSLFIGINLPVGIINTYSLVKNWKETSKMGRAVKSSEILANMLLTGAGSALLLSKLPKLAHLIGPSHAAAAGKAAFILGPIGMGILSVLSLGMGAVSTKQAVGYEAQRKEAAEKLTQTDDPLEQALHSREVRRFSAMRDFSIANSVKYFLVGIGIGLGALVMSGIIAGSLVTPLGWVAAGLVGAGLVISIGVLVVRKRSAAEKEREENDTLVAEIVSQLDLEGRSVEEAVKALNPLFTDDVLNSRSWPKNPTLLELITKQVT